MRKITLILLVLISFGNINKAYSWNSDMNRAPLLFAQPADTAAYIPQTSYIDTQITPTTTYTPTTFIPMAPVDAAEQSTDTETPVIAESQAPVETPEAPVIIAEPPFTINLVDEDALREECQRRAYNLEVKIKAKEAEIQALEDQYKMLQDDFEQRYGDDGSIGYQIALKAHEEALTKINDQIATVQLEIKASLEEFNQLRTTCSMLNTIQEPIQQQTIGILEPPVLNECQQKIQEMEQTLAMKKMQAEMLSQYLTDLHKQIVYETNKPWPFTNQSRIDELNAISLEYTLQANDLRLALEQQEKDIEQERRSCPN